MDNMKLIIKAQPQNESFARSVVAAYAARLNPTIEEIGDIKTAVSEAVTNAIIHGYGNDSERDVSIECEISVDTLTVKISDEGKGIPDVVEAMKDFYTTLPAEERSGLGFTIMASFMNGLEVSSKVGEGTVVTMTKTIGKKV